MTAVIAHRGSGPLGPEPENTAAAFLAARALGADGVELDVRRTADRHLVVHHDADLGDGRRLVEVRRGDLPDGIATLEEALEACAGMVVNVEIKNASVDPDFDPSQWVATATAAVLLRAVGSGRLGGGVVVSSFSRRCLAAFSEAAPRIETAFLVGADRSAGEAVAAALAIGASGVHPYDGAVDGAYVEQAHRAGLSLRVWTVDDAQRIADLVGLGVEAVVTNDVGTALAARRRAELAKGDRGREQSGT